MAMQSIGLGLVKAKRLNPMEIFGGHNCKDKSDFQKMIAKAREIEDRRQRPNLNGEQNGKETIRVLPRLLFAEGCLGVELPAPRSS